MFVSSIDWTPGNASPCTSSLRPSRPEGLSADNARIAIALVVAMTALLVSAGAAAFENGDVLIGSAGTGDAPALDGQYDRPLLVAIDTPYELFSELGSLIHVAAWTPEGEPADGAWVYYGTRAVGRTNRHGTFAFRHGVATADVQDYVENGGVITVVWDRDENRYRGNVWFSVLSRTESFATDHIHVYTDRGVFSPGDDIRLRTIAWHLADDYTALTDAEVEFTLVGPDGRVVCADTARSGDFGTAATSLFIPTATPDGEYQLRASAGDAHAETRLQIRRFEVPELRVTHDLGRFLTRDTRDLAFEVHAESTTETPLGEATLTAEIRSPTSSWEHTAAMVDGVAHLQLDESTITELTGGMRDGQTVNITLRVESHDGRHARVDRVLRYAVNPWVVVVETDRTEYAPGDPIELFVRVSDLDRVPARNTHITARTSRGEHAEAHTSEDGVARFTFSMLDDGFDVDIYIDDVDDAVAGTHIDWQEPQPMRSRIEEPIVREGATVPLTVTFPAGFVPVEEVVHADVVDTSGALEQALLLRVREDDGVYSAHGEFSAPSWGSMLITLFALGRPQDVEAAASGEDTPSTGLGLLTEGQQLLVHPNRELTIHLNGIPDRVDYGDGLNGSVRVEDTNGHRVDASLGVAVVHSAVLAMKDPLEITPMDTFYNPELRTLANTGAQMLTWPVVSRNWGPNQNDVALPPFSYQEGGAIDFVPTDRRQADNQPEQEVQGAEYYSVGGVGSSAVGHGYGMGGGGAYGGTYGSAAGGLAEQPQIQSLAASGDGEVLANHRSAHERLEAAGPGTRIEFVVRTEVSPTLLWDPEVLVENGRGGFAAQLGTATGDHEVVLVASDRNGGVGVLRHTVSIQRDVEIRVDAPAEATLAVPFDVLATVVNHGVDDDTFELEFRGDNVPSLRTTVFVPAGGHAGVRLNPRVDAPGVQHWQASAVGSHGADAIERDVFVLPQGAPDILAQVSPLTSAAPTVMTIDVPTGAEWTRTTLDVRLPTISSSFAGLDALRRQISESDAVSLGGDLLTTLALLRHQQSGVGSDVIPLDDTVAATLRQLLDVQRSDGGWSFWWHPQSSVFVSSWVLEAMIEARRAGYEVPSERIRRGATYISRALRDLAEVDDIAFWEGDGDAIRSGISAEAFRVLTMVDEELRSAEVDAAIATLAGRAVATMEATHIEILAYANNLLALAELRAAGGHAPTDDELSAWASRLQTQQQHGHWEPGWFHAYGGSVEATAAVLRVFDVIDGDFESERRAAVRYLMTTMDELGGWHNVRSSAVAIRSLLSIAAPAESDASEIVVIANNTEIMRVQIDAADPWLASMQLRGVDLSPWLRPGRNTLELRYDGGLEATAAVRVEAWGVDASDMGTTASTEAIH